jgi:hypothetical protein
MSDFPYVLPENTELSDWTPPVDPDLLVVREISAKQLLLCPQTRQSHIA